MTRHQLEQVIMNHTKEQILNYPIVGNAYSDARIFELVHEYTMDESNSFKDRADVQEHVEVQVMGEESSRSEYPNDEAYVNAYIHGIEIHPDYVGV